MVLKLFRQAKKAYDVYKRNKSSKEAFEKANPKGYEMVRPKGKSTKEGQSKVKMLKTTNPMIKKGRDAIEEGESALKKAKQPGQYFMDTGEEARKSKRTVKLAKDLRDTKRTQRKMEDVQKRVLKLKTPMEMESYKKGGVVKSIQIKGWGKARRR